MFFLITQVQGAPDHGDYADNEAIIPQADEQVRGEQSRNNCHFPDFTIQFNSAYKLIKTIFTKLFGWFFGSVVVSCNAGLTAMLLWLSKMLKETKTKMPLNLKFNKTEITPKLKCHQT